MNLALVLIDIQNDYFENGTNTRVGSDKAGKNARLILEKFRSTELPIVHIQHIATSPTATFFRPNTIGAEIHDSVKPLAHEKVVVKHFPNGFRETDMLDYLKSKSITDLVVCGMMTHMCVDATTRAAKDLGFNITLIGDACATKDLEIHGERVAAKDVHNSFLAALNNTYANVIATEQYLGIK